MARVMLVAVARLRAIVLVVVFVVVVAMVVLGFSWGVPWMLGM